MKEKKRLKTGIGITGYSREWERRFFFFATLILFLLHCCQSIF